VISNRFRERYQKYLSFGVANQVDVYLGSLTDFDWSDGDIIFANSTCFDDDLMEAISLRAEDLKAGAYVVTFTKGLSCRPRTFELLERKRYKMSWGAATVFIHRRLRSDGIFLHTKVIRYSNERHVGFPVGPPSLSLLPSDDIEYDDYDNSADDDDDDDKGSTNDERESNVNNNSIDEFRHVVASPPRSGECKSVHKYLLNAISSILLDPNLDMTSPQDSALLQRKRREFL
jgi:hypothetical protein